MLYTAVLVACLASTSGAPASSTGTPSDCRTHEMLINGGANPMSAFVEAQSRAAQWLAEHPGLSQKSLVIRTGRGV